MGPAFGLGGADKEGDGMFGDENEGDPGGGVDGDD